MKTHQEFLKDPVLIRVAGADDVPALELLADLDSARALSGPVLLAELGEEPVAALALTDGRPIANPFLPTAEVVALLRLRARQMDPSATLGDQGRLAGWSAAARKSVSDTGDRLHRILERVDVAVERLDRRQQPIEHRR